VSRLTRVHEVLARAVDAGVVPGAVAVVARHGEVHIETVGNLAFAGAAAARPMAVDTICRLGSTSKPLVAACAMTLVEDGTLRLDDPVDEFLPELADMTVLADVDGPLDDTVAAERSITLRDLLTFRLGTGMVLGDSATSSIAGALAEIERGEGDELEPPPDEWIRRLGALPLLHQPGECWMYETAANVTVVLVSRATGTSFGAALQQRICEPLGMKDTGFFRDGNAARSTGDLLCSRRRHWRARRHGRRRRLLHPAACFRVGRRRHRLDAP
jgi:CubicO group peptidase (beta-lactamase class C family)